MKGKHHLGGKDVDGRIMFKIGLVEIGCGVCSGLNWLETIQ
jgi:hypothetical protein